MDVETRIEELEQRIETLENQHEIDVRVVDTDSGKKIVLEDQKQRWLSPKYFQTILDDIEDET